MSDMAMTDVQAALPGNLSVLERCVFGPSGQYTLQEAVLRNLTWQDARNLRRTSHTIRDDPVLTTIWKEGAGGPRKWLVRGCMYRTHATKSIHWAFNHRLTRSTIRQNFPNHPNQHNCDPTPQPLLAQHLEALKLMGCPHTEEDGYEIQPCPEHPGSAPFLVCRFHMYLGRQHSRLQQLQRIDRPLLPVPINPEVTLCDDCFDHVYVHGAPSCRCIAELAPLVTQTKCVDCFDRAIIKWSRRSRLDPHRREFQCNRCLRMDRSGNFPLVIRKSRSFQSAGWQTPGRTSLATLEPSYCDKCQGTSWTARTTRLWKPCEDPARCNCDWHHIYRFIRSTRTPHPPMRHHLSTLQIP